MITVRTRIAANVQLVDGARLVKLFKASLTMCEPVVTVKQGKLRGAVEKNVLGSTYIAFKRIPFAAPPVGNLRFKDPQPPETWTDIKDTGKAVCESCTQLKELPPFEPIGDEDCLYLNVYTNSFDQRRPVMFWIHGGAFIVGGSGFHIKRPDYLLTQDVVVVITNYRLGAFGFLNLGHKVAPGNQGVKDLIAALEWVKENISNFGGDPNSVTIFGPSAGGALVNALLLSPRTKGLFHKAILQSGSLNCPWAVKQSRPERGFKLASLLGKDSNDPVEVVEFLRTVSAKDIVKAQASILSSEEVASFQLAFGVNCDAVADNPVLPEPDEQLQSKGMDIPVMIGSTKDEFIMFFKDKSEKAFVAYNKYLSRHVKNLAAANNLGEAETERLLNKVKDVYFNGKPMSAENIPKLVEFFSDFYFAIPAMLLVENRIKEKTAPHYLYKYSYTGTQKTSTDLLIKRVISGASHVDEVAYLFYLPLCKTEDPDPPAVGTKDRITIERMVRLWANFAKEGNPTARQDKFVNASWTPVTKEQRRYLDIGDELKLLPIPRHVLSSE